jgi:hypothetical protein
MRSVSVGVNSRAPLRISTLFWLFMFFSFHHLGPLSGPQSSSREFFPADNDGGSPGAAERAQQPTSPTC